MKILIVDDYQSILEVLKEVYSLDGHEVEQASTKDEALLKLKENKFDAVVTDWHLGGHGPFKIYSDEIIVKAYDSGAITVVHTGTDDETGRLAKVISERPGIIKLEKPSTLEDISRAVER